MTQAKSASETIVDRLVICLEILSHVAEILPLGRGFLMLMGRWVCFWPREGSGTAEVQPTSGENSSLVPAWKEAGNRCGLELSSSFFTCTNYQLRYLSIFRFLTEKVLCD